MSSECVYVDWRKKIASQECSVGREGRAEEVRGGEVRLVAGGGYSREGGLWAEHAVSKREPFYWREAAAA